MNQTARDDPKFMKISQRLPRSNADSFPPLVLTNRSFRKLFLGWPNVPDSPNLVAHFLAVFAEEFRYLLSRSLDFRRERSGLY